MLATTVRSIEASRRGMAAQSIGHPPSTVEKMLEKAMRGEWREAAEIYARLKEGQLAMINQTGDTVLHLAVSSRVESNVKLLMRIIPKEILKIKNKSGDTPLHLAAALGMREACQDMAKLCPDLVIQARNNDGDTPFFKAARHGQRKAFNVLRDATTNLSSNLDFCRNSAGDTILHVALFHEYYGLALEIVQCYPSLATQHNQRGVLPIHILATKPSAFRSGAPFKNLLDHLIYQCMRLDHVNDIIPWVEDTFQTTGYRFGQRTVRDEENPEEPEAERRQANQDDSKRKKQNFPDVRRSFQKYCDAPFNFFRLAICVLLGITGISGLWMRVIKIKEQKKRHVRARHIMIELLKPEPGTRWDFGQAGMHPSKTRRAWFTLSPEEVAVERAATSMPRAEKPPDADLEHGLPSKKDMECGLKEEKQLPPSKAAPQLGGFEREFPSKKDWAESPILLAAKNGIKELVEYILKRYPVAVFDLDSNGKNIVLLAVEHRQSHVYELMLKRKEMWQSVFGIVDNNGNSAAHLAAQLGPDQPQIIPGPALRMQWEVKWFKYVERSMDLGLFPRYNKVGLTAREIFTMQHKNLVTEGGKWLSKISQSCSVIAALIATVAFTAPIPLPTWGVGQNSSFFSQASTWGIISASAVIAQCFSVTALTLFLSFITCRYEQWAFETELPLKLILNLTSLYVSLAATAVCFIAGYFLFIDDIRGVYQYPLYAALLVPISIYGVPQIPIYVGLIKATLSRIPEPALPAS